MVATSECGQYSKFTLAVYVIIDCIVVLRGYVLIKG